MAVWFGLLTKLAVALLVLHAWCKLSRQNLLAGLGHWRLHLVVMASTFVLFRCWGCCSRPWCPRVAEPGHLPRFPLLCALPPPCSRPSPSPPWRGAVSAAVCSASASSILGIFPLAGAGGADDQCAGEGSIPGTHSGHRGAADVAVRGGAPVAPPIGRWVDSHRPLMGKLDQSSILLVVYVAFSEAVVQGSGTRSVGTIWPASCC